MRGPSRVPLYEQIGLTLREAILTHTLRSGARLASTRTLAAAWGVSRFTVVQAVEPLLAEGYLQTRRGAGTFVVETTPDASMRAPPANRRPSGRGPTRAPSPRLSSRGAALSSVTITGPRPSEPRPFHPRRAPLDVFPLRVWTRIVRRHWAGCQHARLDYGEPAGHLQLREAIAAHVTVTRAVRCSARQVVVTSGSQQAFDILFRLLLDPGDRVWIEDPGYLDVRAALIAAGADLVPVPVDASGLDVAEGRRRAPTARLAVVSPSHHYPTGVTLSASRRAALLDWARQTTSWIVEDDYDSYFRYSGRPMSALQGVDVDARARVIYVGTFSKTVFPSLRLGFCVVPDHIVDAVVNARAVADRNSPLIDQLVLAEFISSGHYDRHLRRVRAACQERYAALRRYCEARLPELELAPVGAGTHVVARFRHTPKVGGSRHGSFATAVAEAASDEGLVVFPLSRYCLTPPDPDALVLGFGGVTPRRIAAGVEQLRRVVNRVRADYASALP